MKNTVTKEWLHARINDANVRVVDCRYYMGDATKGMNEYIENHIPGAVYFDLELDLSSPVQNHGGRHPLPEISEFVDKLSAAGIDNNTIVVAYDNQASAMASRFWWLMRYLGHERAFILDGGYDQWVQAGYPITTDVPQYEKKMFTPQVQTDMIATMEDVRAAIRTHSALLIDSREPKRYLGYEEPIDRIAGHIPTAKNYFWREGLTEEGNWKDENFQSTRFQEIPKDTPLIVYCGSGVTACPNILALDEAGYANVKLYVGSWSDWISYSDNNVARKYEENTK